MASANDADMSAMNNLYKPNNANWVQGDYGAAGAWSGGYNPQGTLTFNNAFGAVGGFSGDYRAQHVVVGVSYHF